jgi:putative SOS response-associated peptidase YedK
MCGGVEYKCFNPKSGLVEVRKTYFPIPLAQLPVVGSKGAGLVTWGRRKGEMEHSGLPAGGWARLDSLEKGRWNKFHPQPVIIPVRQFMEKDKEGKSHWFKLSDNEVIRGIGVIVDGKPVVYVVTIDSGETSVHNRTPQVISLDDAKEQLGAFEWREEWPWEKPSPPENSQSPENPPAS